MTESTAIEDLGELIVIEAKQLEELVQNQRKVENESADKRRFKADVEKAVCLSLGTTPFLLIDRTPDGSFLIDN